MTCWFRTHRCILTHLPNSTVNQECLLTKLNTNDLFYNKIITLTSTYDNPCRLDAFFQTPRYNLYLTFNLCSLRVSYHRVLFCVFHRHDAKRKDYRSLKCGGESVKMWQALLRGPSNLSGVTLSVLSSEDVSSEPISEFNRLLMRDIATLLRFTVNMFTQVHTCKSVIQLSRWYLATLDISWTSLCAILWVAGCRTHVCTLQSK